MHGPGGATQETFNPGVAGGEKKKVAQYWNLKNY